MVTKEEILKLVAEYISEKHAAKTWTPGVDWVQYSGPYFNSDEYVRAIDSLLKEWLVLGEDAIKFEKKFSSLLGKTHGVVVNSGSSANLLMMAAAASKIKRWNIPSMVIVPVAGFPTTLNPILQLGLNPLFVDIELDTLNLNLDEVERVAKHSGARFITFAHVLGNPPDMNKLMYIASTYGLTILEDCCDALGSTYNGRPLGSYGRFATCSFYPAHHITSLPYDELILLKTPDNRITSHKIGYFVENIDINGWKCPAFDKNGKIDWRDITGIVSHPFTDIYLYKITTQTGRNSTITGNHSLFKLDEKKNITTIKADELCVGDFIIVPNKLPNIEEKITIDYINYTAGSWKEFTSKVNVSAEFSNFLGWFVAEGSLCKTGSGNYNITLTLHKDEIPIASRLSKFIASNFNISSHIYMKGENAISLQFSNKAMYNFLKYNCGMGAKNKHIPEFIFRSSYNIKWAFLTAYYNGDGHHHIIQKSQSNSFDCKTVSKQLAYDIHHLFLMMGVPTRISTAPPKKTWIHKNKKSTITSETHSICYNRSLNGITNSDGFRSNEKKKFPRRCEDLTMVKITKIEKIKYDKPNVYDISVKGYENFISGMGFVVHNTGEGGFVACNDEDDEKILRSLREWGRGCYCVGKKANLSTRGTCGCRFKNWLPSFPSEIFDHKYVYDQIGYNLKPIELQCSMGLAQIDKLPDIHASRRANYTHLLEIFTPYEEFFHIHRATLRANPSWFAFPLTVRDGAPFKRSQFTKYLEGEKIQTRNYFGGNLLLQPAYAHMASNAKTEFPVATKVTTDTLFLGTSPVVTAQQLDYVEQMVQEFFKKI